MKHPHVCPDSLPLPVTGDLPPAYDLAIHNQPIPSGEGSNSGSGSSQPPSGQAIKHHQHLFTDPPNAEPILGRQFSPLHELKHIKSKVRGKVLHSWDPRLSNADVLHEFLRAQALKIPRYTVTCTGSHLETYTRDETYFENGTAKTRRQNQTERIVDFDFHIDLSTIINRPDNKANVHLYTVPPDVPAHRGTHHLSYSAAFAPPSLRHRQRQGDLCTDTPAAELASDNLYTATDVGRSATRKDKKLSAVWDSWRSGKGLPGWSSMLASEEFWLSSAAKGKKPKRVTDTSSGFGVEEHRLMLPDHDDESQHADLHAERGELARQADSVREGPAWSEPSLKEWCDKYTRDHGWLKEFRLRREAWGWDTSGLEAAIRGTINSTGYESNDISVNFELAETEVVVHPHNLLSRAIGHSFIYFLLWITLIYPCIWLWQRLSSSGGATYDIARASYCTKFYPPVPSTFPNEAISSAQDRLPAIYKLHPELPIPHQPNPNAGPSVRPAGLTLASGPKGVHYLLGRKEGEWYREWEERIRMGVRMRYKGELTGGWVGEGVGRHLDGY